MQRVKLILDKFATPSLVTQRKFVAGGKKCCLLFNADLVGDQIVRAAVGALEKSKRLTGIEEAIENILPVGEAEQDTNIDKVIENLLSGDSLLIIDGVQGIVVIKTRKYDKRSVAEPPTETVMRGPREGFIEDIKTNLTLIERRLRTPAFAVERFSIGRQSNSNVALVYLANIADPELVDLIRTKLKGIDVDALIDSHYLQPLLEPHPYSIFHQTGVTEKPDIVVSKLLEGRVALIVDGSPMVLTVPFLFIEDFQNSEDYYERSAFASFLRLLRYVAAVIGILLPGLYVALQIYHYDVIPVMFLLTVMNAVKGIPLAPLPEILFVMLLFEIIREASVRMPRAVGMAMSIVGALVLGETAVKAGMISSPAVMVVALSSIALYTIPNEVGTMSLIRVAFAVIGGMGGLFGLLLGTIFLLFRLCSMDSFGTPYFAPYAPFVAHDIGDALIREGYFQMKERPESIPNINPTRQGVNKDGE